MKQNEEYLINNIGSDTLPELFSARVQRSSRRVAYSQFNKSTSNWEEFTWAQVSRRVDRWRAGFEATNLKIGDRVAILLDNCVEWVCFDQAALGRGLVVVPLYRTDSPKNWAHILSDCVPRFLLVSSEDEWRQLAPLRDHFASIERIVSVHPPVGDAPDPISLHAWLPDASVPVNPEVAPDALATITYTSGTTGRPKGVMLSHGNLISATRAVLKRNGGRTDDVFLAYLPMAHIFERTVEYYSALAAGSRLTFARSVSHLQQDLLLVRPTIIMGVPRIYERAWSLIQKTASSSALSRTLFRRALTLGRRRPARSILERIQRWLIHRLFCKRVMEQFGGHLRLAICGSAPLSRELAQALRAVGVPIVEGYGLVEAAGPISGDAVTSYLPGSVGPPLDGVEVRITDNGELLVHSTSVMRGYWNRPEDTARTLDRDGWLHTGDLADVRDGRLFIQGRVCDIIVTATAEKLAPSDLETRIVSDPLFEQAVVLGNGRPFLVALVTLEAEQWKLFAKANHLDPADPNEKRAERLLIKRLSPLIADFPSYAQIRRLFATLEAWTSDEGLATATLKTKRASVERKYADTIASLYEGHVSADTHA